MASHSESQGEGASSCSVCMKALSADKRMGCSKVAKILCSHLMGPLYEPAATGGADGADPGLELPAEARGAGVGVHVAPDLHRRLARRPVRRPLRRAALRHDCKCKMKIRAICLSPYLTRKNVCEFTRHYFEGGHQAGSIPFLFSCKSTLAWSVT